MDSKLQERKSTDIEYKVRCYISKIEIMIDSAKRLLNEVVWKKTRLVAIEKEIFDTNRLKTERLQHVQDLQAKIKDEQELLDLLSRRTSHLKRQKTALLTPADNESQATRVRTQKRKSSQLDSDDIVSKKVEIDKELDAIGKQITRTRHTVQKTEAEIVFEQETIANHSRHVDELRRLKTELAAFANDVDDKIHQILAITISATPPTIGQHNDDADSTQVDVKSEVVDHE